MSDKSTNAKDTNVILWIVVAFLAASLLGSIGILVWLGARKSRALVHHAATSAPSPHASISNSAATSFAELSDADVPGRYKITDADKVMYVVLNEDHTFINTDGTTYPTYEWGVSADRLVITWQRSSSTFDFFEKPGVYSRKKTDGSILRMEKLPDLPPAETIAINDEDVIASIIFTADLQTNQLIPVNLEGDGKIFPGEAGGQECHQLIRQRSRMSAFFYVRVAPELKAEPFTNALVMIEYFDSPARDPRNGWLSLQYDARDGPYTSTGQRVRLEGTMKWTRATFVLDAPLFHGAQSDQADFRLCVANPDLSIRVIKLVKNKPV